MGQFSKWGFFEYWAQRAGRLFGKDLDAPFNPTTGHTHDGVDSPALAGSASIPNDAVTTAKIADDAVTTAKINAKAVTSAELADAVNTSLGKADTALQPDCVAAQADSTAADTAGIVADFNALLAKLRTANVLHE